MKKVNKILAGILSFLVVLNFSISFDTTKNPIIRFGCEVWADGIDSYTKVLLHMDGTNGSTTFTDSSFIPKTWTAHNHAQLNSSLYKFGAASGFFDGTDDYIDTPNSTDFNFGNGDFTIDFWVKLNLFDRTQYIAGQRNAEATDPNNPFTIFFWAGSKMYAQFHTGVNYDVYSDNSITDTNWHHVAIVRYGATIKMYIDGAVQTRTANIGTATLQSSSNKFAIGRLGELNSDYFNGRIDEFRVSKGIARWTSNFTPPASPYTMPNTSPSISIFSPTQNGIFFATDTAIKPQIAVTDLENDTLTCKYYIDSEPTPRDTISVSNTSSAQTISFNTGINMNLLSEGNHTIRCEASDGVAAPVSASVNITVNKAPYKYQYDTRGRLTQLGIYGSNVKVVQYTYDQNGNLTKKQVFYANSPTNFRVTNSKYNNFTLAWSAVNGATGYKIYKNGQYVLTTASTQYIDTTLQVNTSYTFDVSTAINGDEGIKSHLSATTTP